MVGPELPGAKGLFFVFFVPFVVEMNLK